jgi:hypothetical protein
MAELPQLIGEWREYLEKVHNIYSIDFMHLCDANCIKDDCIIQLRKGQNIPFFGCVRHGRYHYCDRTKHECFALYNHHMVIDDKSDNTYDNRVVGKKSPLSHFHSSNSLSRSLPCSPTKRRKTENGSLSVGSSPRENSSLFSEVGGFKNNKTYDYKNTNHVVNGDTDSYGCIFSRYYHSTDYAPDYLHDPKCSNEIRELAAKGKLQAFLRKEINGMDYDQNIMFDVNNNMEDNNKKDVNVDNDNIIEDTQSEPQHLFDIPTETKRPNIRRTRVKPASSTPCKQSGELLREFKENLVKNGVSRCSKSYYARRSDTIYPGIESIINAAQYNNLELNLVYDPSEPYNMFVEPDNIWYDVISKQIMPGLEKLKNSICQVVLHTKQKTKIIRTRKFFKPQTKPLQKVLEYKAISTVPVSGNSLPPTKDTIRQNRSSINNEYDAILPIFQSEMKKKITSYIQSHPKRKEYVAIIKQVMENINVLCSFAQNLYNLTVSRIGIALNTSVSNMLYENIMDATMMFFAKGLQIRDGLGNAYVLCPVLQSLNTLLPKDTRFKSSSQQGAKIAMTIIDQLSLHPETLNAILYNQKNVNTFSFNDV